MAEAVIPAWHYKRDFIFNPVKGTVNCFGGFDKITAVVTDGSPAVGGVNSFIGLLKKKYGVNFLPFQWMRYQKASCRKVLALANVMEVVKVINLVREKNGAFNGYYSVSDTKVAEKRVQGLVCSS